MANDLARMLDDWRRFGPAIKRLLVPLAEGPRLVSPVAIEMGYTTSSIPARAGNVVKAGTVRLTKLVAASPQTTPNSWTITDQGRADVKAINLTGGAVDQGATVVMVRIFGLRIVILQDCKFSVASGGNATPVPATAP